MYICGWMYVYIYINIYCNIYNIYHIFIIIYVNKKATPNNDQKSIPKDSRKDDNV